MQTLIKPLRRIIFALVLGMGASSSGFAQEKVALNFVNAEIDSVVRAIGSFTNKTFVVDPRVKGTINLISQTPVTRQEAYNTLLAALRLQGFTIVEAGGVARVLPENDAKTQAAAVDPKRAMDGGGGQILTQVFKLNYESATNLVPVLRPLITPNNTIAAYPNNNTLVITDYADNLKRIARIISTIDGPASSELEVIPVKYALAVDLAASLTRLLDEGNRGTGAAVDPGQRLTVLADPRTNSLMLRASSTARIDLAKTLINRLDQPTAQPGNVWVVYLKNAEATKLAQTLRSVLTSDTSNKNSANSGLSQSNSNYGSASTGGLSGNNAAGQVANATSTPGTALSSPFGGNTSGQNSAGTGSYNTESPGIVQADSTTNSLIITAPEPVYRNLRSIIEKLDVRRAQVYVESLIVEVSADKAAEFGIQFQSLNGLNSNGVNAIGGTNFGARGSGTNIIDGATNVASLAGGLNIGVIRGTVNVPGIGSITNLGLLARALESNANANILSTPNLITLDNEEAKIVIGQNVPFITGQFTSAGTGATVNPFQTIERKDVGLTLRVKPQVSEGGVVKLAIYQEVSSVQDRSQAAGIITNKRSIESNVLVDDGQIIVLGGLVEDRYGDTEQLVPGLGNVPVIGSFFRYDTRKRTKTNLMVFLRPIVLRNTDQSNSLVTDRYDYIRASEQNIQPVQRFGLPNEGGPLLPPKSSIQNQKPMNVVEPIKPSAALIRQNAEQQPVPVKPAPQPAPPATQQTPAQPAAQPSPYSTGQ